MKLIFVDDDDLPHWASTIGALVIRFDCRVNRTGTMLVAAGKKSHGFPPYVAANLNALNDVLHDWGWIKEERAVVLFSSIDRNSRLSKNLIEICTRPLRDFYHSKPSVVFAMSFLDEHGKLGR